MVEGLWHALADLVLPVSCAACGEPGTEVCVPCAGAVQALRPHPVAPAPAPPGFPPCYALGEYGGELRELILAYKERGRHRLARPLGALLADVAAAATPA